jgi:hypothetical protein
MQPGDLVQHRSGQFAPALVLKIDGHSCHPNSTVTIMNTGGKEEQIYLAYLRIINTSYNPYDTGQQIK